ncbi:MAG: family 16 glycosylhydrolase [Propionicimonas sp.]
MIRLLKLTAVGVAAALAASVLVGSTTAAAATKTITDKKATVTVTPYDGVTVGKITVKFTKSQILTTRSVQLQRLSGKSWVNVGEPKPMSSTGTVTFTFPQPDPPAAPNYSLPGQTSSYRAVAAAVPANSKFKTNAVTPAAKSKRLIDQKATWSYHPVANGANGSLTVTFSSSYRTKNRPVQLQVLKSGKWSNVGKKVKMSSKGVAVFPNVFTTASDSGKTYRAVAPKYKKKLEAVTVPATPTTSASAWKVQRDYSFSTNAALNSEWSTWDDGDYSIRKCSANAAANTTMTGGYATLKVRDAGKAGLSQAKAAKCPSAQKYAYTNGMVTTSSNFTISHGIVAARVKFSKNRYMHGGVWLHAADGSDEIDIIESYGYAGKKSAYSKTTSGVHQRITKSEHSKLKKPKGWEKTYKDGLAQTVFNIRKLPSSWFDRYHVVSVEFTSTKLVFRVDGKVTGTLTRAKTVNDYSLVMSMLTTDWELAQARKTTSKGKLKNSEMKVDWVRVWQK